MRKLSILIHFLIIGISVCYAQTERSNWEFLSGNHLNHNGTVPTLTNRTSSSSQPFWASYSDVNGNAIFSYRNDTLYDRVGNVMQGYVTTYQNNKWDVSKSIPFKHPRGNGRYGMILLYRSSGTSPNDSIKLGYLEIDSIGNAGRGTLIKDTVLKSFHRHHSSLIELIQHCNQRDYWLVLHDGDNTNKFTTYLISQNGFNPASVVSNIGPQVPLVGRNSQGYFYDLNERNHNMKASPDGSKLAIASRMSTFSGYGNAATGFYLFDFDNSNGIISNPIDLTPNLDYHHLMSLNQDTATLMAFDVCFSQNSQKLYGSIVGYVDGRHVKVAADSVWGIHQWDVSSGNPSTIQNSFTQVFRVDTLQGITPDKAIGFVTNLQRAPNGKIYFNRSHENAQFGFNPFAEYLGVIHSPQQTGLQSNLQPNYIFLGKQQTSNYRPATILPLFPNSANGFSSFTVNSHCLSDTAEFDVSNASCLLSAKWNFDDTASGVFNTDTGFSVKHKFSSPGIYNVRLIAQYASHTDTFYRKIDMEAPPAPFLGNDTILCVGDSILLKDSSQNQSIVTRWFNGSYGSTQWVKNPGSYWISQTNPCGIRYDTIQISPLTPPSIQLRTDTNLCLPDSINIGSQALMSTYLWNTGSKDSVISVSHTGDYILTVTNACGVDQDTVSIKSYDSLPSQALGVDTAICAGVVYQINLKTSAYKYTWQDGSTSASNLVNKPGIYWVELVNACGTFSDTLKVDSLTPPVVDLGSDTVICKNGILILDATQPLASYNWTPAGSAPQYRATSAGSYAVTVTNPCGSEQDSIIISPLKKPGIDLGLDTAICPGDSLLLSVSADLASYIWHNNAVDSSVLAKTAGTYWVKASNQCGSDSSGINIRRLVPAKINLTTTDTLLCNDQSWTVDVTQDKGNYHWSSGSTSPVQIIQNEGLYAVTVSNACARDSVEINVQHFFSPNAILPPDTAICYDTPIRLSSSESRVSWQWSTGSDSNQTYVTKSGIYWLRLQNPCGISTDSIEVVFSQPPRLTSATFYHFCPGDRLSLSLSATDTSTQFYWEDLDSYGAEQLLLSAGDYKIYLTNQYGCASTSVIELNNSNCEHALYIPNSFTPNTDQNNERWRVYSEASLNEFNVKVYNRWGQIVYESSDQEEGWDGTYTQEIAANADVYTYLVTYRDNQSQLRKETGTVTLIR